MISSQANDPFFTAIAISKAAAVRPPQYERCAQGVPSLSL